MDEFTLFALEAGSDQLHLTARVDRENGSATAAAENICAAAESALDSYGMRILNERVFGTLDFHQTYTRIRRKHRKFAQCPCSYIQGTPVYGQGLSGIQIHAVKPFSDENPRVLYDGKRPCGSVWRRQDTTYVHIAGLHGLHSGSRSRVDQAAAMFEAMKRLLASQSTDFRNVVRTWIYLDDILEWYDVFNAVRRERFSSFGLIPASAGGSSSGPVYLPASTGIGGRNPAGASCCGDALAVSGHVQVSVLSGMLQPSAYSYGSAFSRGICIEEKECRQIFVSGTAAIDATGRSLYPRNAAAQIGRTLEVVESLIGEKGAKFKDIRSATVYLKKAGDLSVYEKLAGRLGLMNLPAVFVVADICRDELLFEMDALAVIDKTA
jgi:enamine deaminase RidA (YjgF/YER057c/UK114 family)